MNLAGLARLLLLLAAAGVALAVWTWLPPSAADRAAIEQSVLRYELAGRTAWPADRRAQAALPAAVAETLRSRWRAALEEVAEGDALDLALRTDPVAYLVEERARDPRRIVVATGGDVVFFDVRRRTLTGAVIVRAGVATWTETGTWDARRDAVVGVTRHVETLAPLYDYALRQRGDTWKVVGREPPPASEPGFYDSRTGEFATGG